MKLSMLEKRIESWGSGTQMTMTEISDLCSKDEAIEHTGAVWRSKDEMRFKSERSDVESYED